MICTEFGNVQFFAKMKRKNFLLLFQFFNLNGKLFILTNVIAFIVVSGSSQAGDLEFNINMSSKIISFLKASPYKTNS